MPLHRGYPSLLDAIRRAIAAARPAAQEGVAARRIRKVSAGAQRDALLALFRTLTADARRPSGTAVDVRPKGFAVARVRWMLCLRRRGHGHTAELHCLRAVRHRRQVRNHLFEAAIPSMAGGWARPTVCTNPVFKLDSYLPPGHRFYRRRAGIVRPAGASLLDRTPRLDKPVGRGEVAHELDRLQFEFVAEWLFFDDESAGRHERIEYEIPISAVFTST